tara:strand:- start:745 stop:1206 length:462 start_codon:yes stop_codon:yes gene_type:complete
MGWISAVASVAAARQASSIGSYNQAIQNRNAQVAEQKAEALKEQTKFDIARFDQQFEQLTGQTKVATLKSGVELSGSALNILRYNAEQAEIQKDIMDYNSKVAQSQAIEQANFARMQGVVAKQQARSAAIGFYGQAAAGFGQTETGKSLLKRF